MPYFDFRWTDEIIEHLDEHGVSPDDFEEVVSNPRRDRGKSLDRSAVLLGRDLGWSFPVFEKIDDFTIVPVTAYETRRRGE